MTEPTESPVAPPGDRAGTDEREPLGRLVHDVRLACEAERAAAEGRQRFNLGSWEDRDDWQRELDMRIGARVMTVETTRLAAALTAEAAACRAEAARFTDRNPRRPIRVDPSKGQANPDVYAQVQLAHAGLCESLAARLTDPAGDGAAEAKLAALRSVLLEGGQDASTVRRRALAIIGSEEGEGRG